MNASIQRCHVIPSSPAYAGRIEGQWQRLLSMTYHGAAMAEVTFILQDGQIKKVTAENGKTVLQIALENGIPMEHACGGNGFCTTCACEVQGGQAAIDSKAVSPVDEKEVNMGVEGPDTRLGCQTHIFADITVKPMEL